MNVNDKTDFFQVVDNFAKTQNVESLCIFEAEAKCEAKITISIPTYKRVDTLKDTLESALNQEDYDSYLIYVIDNNPERDDETELFMQQYKGGRVSYFKNAENLGMGGNWNRCISLPYTEWVCLLHDDDTIDSNFMNEMTPYLDKLPNVGILQSRKYRDRNHGYSNSFEIAYEKYNYLDFYNGNAIDVPSGIIYNRSKVLTLGGFNQDFYPSLDCVFSAFMSSKFNTFVINNELTWYREGVTNSSKAIETQRGWFVVDYYFTKYLLRKAGIPKYLAETFSEYRCILRAETDMKKWGTQFVPPTDKLPWKDHSKLLGRFLNGLLSRFIYKKRVIRSNKLNKRVEKDSEVK